jgi:hypothetical protein
MNDSDSIVQLEAILNEFYHQTTSNFRKKEIERDLKTFQENDSNWNFLIQCISKSYNSQYLWFFSVSTLEVCNTEETSNLLLILHQHRLQSRRNGQSWTTRSSRRFEISSG